MNGSTAARDDWHQVTMFEHRPGLVRIMADRVHEISVPPELFTAVKAAEAALNEAKSAVIGHLVETGRYRLTARRLHPAFAQVGGPIKGICDACGQSCLSCGANGES